MGLAGTLTFFFEITMVKNITDQLHEKIPLVVEEEMHKFVFQNADLSEDGIKNNIALVADFSSKFKTQKERSRELVSQIIMKLLVSEVKELEDKLNEVAQQIPGPCKNIEEYKAEVYKKQSMLDEEAVHLNKKIQEYNTARVKFQNK